MARPNFVVILCLFWGLFIASAGILHATVIRGAVLHGVVVNQFLDPCAGLSIGQVCTGGALYAGTGYSTGGLNPALRYMAIPGGCTNSSCSGAGGTDGISLAWANGSGTTANGVNTGATSATDGKNNTAILVTDPPHYTDTDAAHWCTNMNYGGYTDWYLPAQNELSSVLYVNRAALGGFQLAKLYMSSTESGTGGDWTVNFSGGGFIFGGKTVTDYVRCVRTY